MGYSTTRSGGKVYGFQSEYHKMPHTNRKRVRNKVKKQANTAEQPIVIRGNIFQVVYQLIKLLLFGHI